MSTSTSTSTNTNQALTVLKESSMEPLQNVAPKDAQVPIGYNGIDARGWLVLSPDPPNDAMHNVQHMQQEDGTMEECWYLLKALLASSEAVSVTLDTAPTTAFRTLLQQQCPRWRGLAKVWVAQKSLHVDYVDAVKQELLLPTFFYTCFSAPAPAPK